MSNRDPEPQISQLQPGQPCKNVEVLTPREVPLGGIRAMTVHRTLPQRARSLVGAWCFLDHYGPDDVAVTGGMSVPRHPHTGLATVSWLFSGEIDHLDSAGNAAAVRPGELNLMLAGRGITHQEMVRPGTSILHGVQLWYALPDAERSGDHDFSHFVPEPVSGAGYVARVFLGSLLGASSPVHTRTPELLGAELILEAGASVSIPVRADFEMAVLAEDGPVSVNGAATEHRHLAYAPPGADTLQISAGELAPGRKHVRVIILGGIPLGEPIIMWWNFVGRTSDEIQEFRRRYQAEMGFEPADPRDAGKPQLFGPFPEGQPQPLPAPVLPAVPLKPRS